MSTTREPAKPMKKLNTITNMLQALGDLNRKVMLKRQSSGVNAVCKKKKDKTEKIANITYM